MTERVRVGVIGAGAIGMIHCQHLARRIPGADFVAVADIDQRAANRAAALADGVVATTNHRAILDDPSVRAVVIATPTDTHSRLVQDAAEAGKDIFCEKPVAADLMSVDAALTEVEQCGVKLQVGFQRRFDRAYREAQRIIAKGELGSVELLVGTTRDPKPPDLEYLKRSGSFFIDITIHDLDSVRFLTGLEIVEVFATASTLYLPQGGSEEFLDTSVTSLRLENGALAVITNSRRAVYGYEVGIEVMGSAGKITVGQEQRTLLRRYTIEAVSHDYVDWFRDRFEDAYVQELVHFVECVERDQQPEVSGEDGRIALELALLAGRSLREGRPVSVAGTD